VGSPDRSGRGAVIMRSIIWGAAALVLAACGADRSAAKTGGDPARSEKDETAPVAGPAVASETRMFRDWTATCDNGNNCVATGPASTGTGWIQVGVNAGGDSLRSVAVGFWPDSGSDVAGPITVRIDGATFITDQSMEQGTGQFVKDAPGAIAALASSRSIALEAGGENVALSPTGAAAALLWIDERQGRLDTTTALVRKGSRPATSVPPEPALPRVVPASEADQTGFGDSGQTLPAAIEKTAEAKECRADTEFSPAIQAEVQSARLGPSTELWGVPCFIGAYNTGMRYFLTGPGGSRPRMITFQGTDQPNDTLTNAGYDPTDRTLSQFAKGRGIGDCGVASTWVWTGRDFVLKMESRMGQCWGVPSDLWPTTWRTLSDE